MHPVPKTTAVGPLPSGRSVLVRLESGGEELEVRSPDGEIELRVTLTPAGPVLHLRGARVEVEAAESLTLAARTVNVAAESFTVRTAEDIRLDGATIRLNCDGAPPPAPPEAISHSCACPSAGEPPPSR